MFILDENTGVLIKKAARLFERLANINLDELGITYSQTIFLVRLMDNEGQTQAELTKSSALRQPSVVHILEKMLKDELIKKIKHPTDNRSYCFYLTAKAKKICSKLEEQGKYMQTLATKKFTAKSINTLNNDLKLIITNLENSLLELNLD